MADLNPWHAGRILIAVTGYFDWWAHPMMTEFDIDGSKADLVFVSKAMYATEVEIKVSLADWNVDQKKPHWKMDRKYISRFFYAIPETLENKIPDWIPDWVGIIVVFDRGLTKWNTLPEYDGIRVVREAKRRRCEKVPIEMVNRMYQSCYYRFWRLQNTLLRTRVNGERLKRKEAQENGTGRN